MGTSLDFNSEAAYWHISMRRQMEKGGAPVRWRPAINRDEKLIADEVNRHVRRTTLGYETSGGTSLSSGRHCDRCGKPLESGRYIGSVYPRSGERIDKFVHAGGCESVPPPADDEGESRERVRGTSLRAVRDSDPGRRRRHRGPEKPR